MAHSAQTIAQLLAVFADGVSPGAITPEDIRSLIVSLIPGHGEFYLTVALPTTIATPGDYVKAAGTTELTSGAHDMDMPASNRLRYTGAVTKRFHVASSLNVTVGDNNQVIGVVVAKNGSVQIRTRTRFKVGAGTDNESTALHGMIELAQNDYLEVFVTNETSTAAVTVENLNLFAMGILDT